MFRGSSRSRPVGAGRAAGQDDQSFEPVGPGPAPGPGLKPGPAGPPVAGGGESSAILWAGSRQMNITTNSCRCRLSFFSPAPGVPGVPGNPPGIGPMAPTGGPPGPGPGPTTGPGGRPKPGPGGLEE